MIAEEVAQAIIVCSFYTDDEYYSAHARTLVENLERLGVPHQISIMEKKPGEDWADICRKKVGFLASVCEKNLDKKVFWIDVDCQLLNIPEFIINSTADIIGFQRGFGSPMNIGYQNRTRFWEPCFWGVNNTPQGRKMIFDALQLEQNSQIKATDDYFFEEGWRANADNLTFQLIPSTLVAYRGDDVASSRPVFFKFGSSGKVAEFKKLVEQHKLTGDARSIKRRVKRSLFNFAKRIHRALPEKIRKKARRISDKTGLTSALTADSHVGVVSPDVKNLLHFARTGKKEDFDTSLENFRKVRLATLPETRMISAAESFLHYSTYPSESLLKLSWWCHPYPGNFGDWLAPYLLQNISNERIELQPLGIATNTPHIIAIGSIGRFIKKSSIVLGTGISSTEYPLEPNAKYFSVRGPRTAHQLEKSGGPRIEIFGDPAVIFSRVYPINRGQTNGKIALIRHHSHRSFPVSLPENFDELSVLMSHPQEIEEFARKLNNYDAVVTSAMHIFIMCQSYGIPVALVTFESFETSVHGDGIKYKDYCEGADVSTVLPAVIPLDMRKFSFDNLMTSEKVSQTKMEEVESSIKSALAFYSQVNKRK